MEPGNESFNNFPELKEQLATGMGGQQVSPVDYVYNSIKSKASTPSLLEKIDGVQRDADYFSSIFNSSQDNKISFNEDRINIDEAYTKLSDGTYITRYDEGFIKGADNEQLYAQNQSTVSKWTNGLGKFLGKTAVNVIGGTLGTAYGAVSAIAEGNWERVYDNEFYDFLDDQNTKMDNFAANYRTQEERDMGFFESMTTANFWADDFLGGMSFMVGTVISEVGWAAATGGTSLTTAASRIGLRASKYFNTVKTLTKGVKDAQKAARVYNRLDAIKHGASLATKYGKTGEALNLARFTYTGAGFESGMEARLYQKEQRENFNRDFESLNGRKPNATEIAEFENNLNDTTNALWATNMALVGTSNFAILGRTLGITSPFKLQSRGLNKALFGNGIKTTFGEAGERGLTEAVKRTKLQKTLGFAKGVFKNPFYEGVVEEGGQAAASTAMESYVTSRYNPSEDVMGVAESMYEGLSHTFGTKQGWKEVGLGMLIGLVGGEGSNALSGGGLFTEARNALNDYDGKEIKNEAGEVIGGTGSVGEAFSKNENTGVNTVNRIFATKFEENLAQATELQNAQQEYEKAQSKGSLMEMANAEAKVMLTSVKNANDFDYLEDQILDFETALKMQDPATIAEHYGIEESEVDSKIDSLVEDYKQIGQSYKAAKEFADYIVSDNPKELFEDGTDVDVRVAKTAIAYQMVMTELMEKNMEGAHEALKDSINELNPELASKYMQALNKFNQINRSRKEDVEALAKSENKLKLKQQQLEKLNNQLLKVDQTKSKADAEGNQRDANRYNNLSNKITEVQNEIAVLTQEVSDKAAKLNTKRDEMSLISSSTRALANQLDTIDPLAGEDLVSQMTIEEMQKSLEELDQTLKEVSRFNPQLVEKIAKLGQEYRKGLEMWQRNADTMADLADPKLGLKRIGNMVQRKKQAGTTTLEFLKRLQQTQLEEKEFSSRIESLLGQDVQDNVQATDQVQTEVNEQEAAEQDPGEDILQDPIDVVTQDPVQNKINELKSLLNKLVGENSFVLENFTNDSQQLEQDKAPTQEELAEYNEIRNKFKSGDINKLVGRPVDQISNRIKERSGLTDQEIQRYQDLSQKMLDWRIVTGTNSEGISIQDILNQIEAYEQEVSQNGTQISPEQVLEMSEQGQSEFSIDTGNPDYVNSMDKVNIRRDKIQTTISHLDITTVMDSDFDVSYLREENVGTEDSPSLVDVYQLEKDGQSFEIIYTRDHHRIIVPNKHTQAFLDGMGMQTVKYNTKTGWGFAFKDGSPMDSDFGINLINNPEVNILNPQLIYELEPGSIVSFMVNMQDVYNDETIIPLIKEGKIDEARNLMSIYVVNENGDVLGFLKAGQKEAGSNFNKVREEAIRVLQERLENSDITLEDLAEDNSNSVFNLPFEVEVEKTFVGTPNIELNQDGSAKVFKITKEQANSIVGFGYAENGNLNEDAKVRKTFIPKGKNTPYVIIQHGNTQVAFPVGITPTASTLQDQVLEILNSDARQQDQITGIIRLLKENGVEPAQFNLDILKDNSNELNKLLSALDGATRTFTKEELDGMTKEEFIAAAEILINLDKPAFVSPKIKMSLSKKLTDRKTKTTTASKGLSEQERQDLIIKHLVYTSKAQTAEDVAKLVMETGDESFIKEFLENKKFNKQVTDASLANNVVPSIQTEASMENILQDIIDINYNDVPLDIQEEFKKEVAELKANPVKSKIKALANKVKRKLENRYKLVNSSLDTTSLYHIPTTETEQEMFDQGYVKVAGDFYKKISKKYDLADLLEGLFNKYKKGTLPVHINLENGLTLEDFVDAMPNTLLDVYKLYYNTQPDGPVNKKAAIVGNEQYLKEDFKGDFAEFIQNEKAKGSELYKQVLQHFQITDKGILKDDLLTREKIDQFEKELGDNYNALVNYSLINKHIDLQEQSDDVIFVEDIENVKRLEAANNPNLIEPEAQATIVDDKTISFTKVNKPFIRHKGSVYEQVLSNQQGEYVYERIANVDPDFLITQISPPFNTNISETNKEVDTTKTNINKTEGRGIDC